MTDYKELKEELKDMVTKYCIAILDCRMKKNIDGYFYVDGRIVDSCYVLAGNFDESYVVDELEHYEFEHIKEEGVYHIEFLMKYVRGDEEEPSYLDILLVEPKLVMTFEEEEKQNKEIEQARLESGLPF